MSCLLATAIPLAGARAESPPATGDELAFSSSERAEFCEAAHAIAGWVAIDPALNGTERLRLLLERFRSRGACVETATAIEETVYASRRNQVITINALINGQRGVFLLDTGASYVTLKQSFARRAGITVDAGRVVRLKTANGVTSAQRGVADSIQIRDARARDVSVVVQPDSQAAYGDRVDGLLGMSFLARFNVSIDGARVTLRPRALPSE